MPRLNNEMHNQMLGMLQAGVSQRQVARRFDVHPCTVSHLLSRFNQAWSLNDRPRPGQPFVTTPRQQAFIRHRHLHNRFTAAATTAREIIGRHGRPIHARTVSRISKRHGIRCRRPYKGLQLKPHHRRYRLQWARQLLNQRQNWSHVVFSDESRFNVSNADGRSRLYRCLRERFADNSVLERDRFGGGGEMVWGAINLNFRSQLIGFFLKRGRLLTNLCCKVIMNLDDDFANFTIGIMTLFAITNCHWPICWMICFIQLVRLSFPYWLWRRVIPYT
jgi:transposase